MRCYLKLLPKCQVLRKVVNKNSYLIKGRHSLIKEENAQNLMYIFLLYKQSVGRYSSLRKDKVT